MTDMKKDLAVEDIAHILWSNKVIIIILSIIVSLSVFVKINYFTRDQFSANCVLYVSNKDEKTITQIIEKSDIDTSRSLSATYIELLKTDSFLESVCEDLPQKCSWRELSSMLSISTVNETELINISVTADSKDEAYDAAVGIMNKAPAMLINVFEGGDAKVVNPPRYPENPIDKGIVIKVAAGFILGTLIGCIYVFIKRIMDKKIHKGDDVANRYGISILGETAQSVNQSRRLFKVNRKVADEIRNVINDTTDFDTVETYKSIRTNIMFSAPKQETGKVIVITSALPGEGKTTTAINLAITFAQTGAKILIIDCDLRRSRVHRYLGIERKEGVSNVVCGYAKLEQAIQKDVKENLDCLTAGETPPNPAELLQSQEFQTMISELQHQYDYIFVDTPPITIVTDAAVLTKQCEGVIIVARSEMTTYDLFDLALDELKNTGAKIIGAIIHESSDKQKKYSYYKNKKYGGRYAYKYAYRYGEDEKK